MEAELLRVHIHLLHKFPRFVDDSSPVTPGKDGCEECGDFNVGFPVEHMRYAHGISRDKKLPAVLVHFLVKEFFQRRRLFHYTNISIS